MAQAIGNPRLAVLIDADNAQPGITEGLLAEVAKYGTAHVKRAYGDWTGPQLKGWKDALLTHSIQPIQQFGYTKGKNATDSALIIDAMDLLYSGRLDGFCLVSSDSDFTRLAARIRESGLIVYGFGEKKTPEPFVAACDKFIYSEILTGKEEDGAAIAPRTTRTSSRTSRTPTRVPPSRRVARAFSSRSETPAGTPCRCSHVHWTCASEATCCSSSSSSTSTITSALVPAGRLSTMRAMAGNAASSPMRSRCAASGHPSPPGPRMPTVSPGLAASAKFAPGDRLPSCSTKSMATVPLSASAERIV